MPSHAAPPRAALRWLTAATAGIGTAALVALYAASIAPDVSQAAEPPPEPPQATTEAATDIAPIFTTPPPPAAQPWSEDDGPLRAATPSNEDPVGAPDADAHPKGASGRVRAAATPTLPLAAQTTPQRNPVAGPIATPSASPAPPADVAGNPPATGQPEPDTVTALANRARADAGCLPVADDPELTAYAVQWAQQQAADQLMRHSDGPYAENVAMGYVTAAEVMSGWMGSSGHRANILECSWTRHGIGSAVGDDGLTYWTQVFGT